MNKTFILSLKTWALLCFYASIAILVCVPVFAPVYSDYVLIIMAIIAYVRTRDDIAIETLCLSVVLSSAIGIVSYYYNQHNILTIQEVIGGELCYAIWFFVSLLPMIYCLYKTRDLFVKIGVVVLVVALIPWLLYAFTSPRLVDISLFMFSALLIGFFLVSAFDTNDSITRNLSILAGLGALAMMFSNIKILCGIFAKNLNWTDGIVGCIMTKRSSQCLAFAWNIV